MTADDVRERWQRHAARCSRCQSASFTRCKRGDALLAQLVRIEPMDGPRQVSEKDDDEPIDAPVLLAQMIAPGRVQVYCDFCLGFHFHGWPSGTPDDSIEHRVAHCHDKSGPYAQTGYYFRLERAA